MSQNLFYNTIRSLRLNEGIVLHQGDIDIPEDQQDELEAFLESEYLEEKYDFPIGAPTFNKKAGLWAAKTIYIAAQLILKREIEPENLDSLFPKNDFEHNVENALSVDLCMRFMGEMISKLEQIDSTDPLIVILVSKLIAWPYSGIYYFKHEHTFDYKILDQNGCYTQLIIERIIASKNEKIASNLKVNTKIREMFGDHLSLFWQQLPSKTNNE